MIPIISFVGKSGSGKTTVLEKVLPEIKRRGYRVGTVKHDSHDFDIDHPGKDTWRHFHAGSDSVMIASPHKIALIRRVEETQSLVDLVSTYCHGMDIVITEGYKRGDRPKIEVVRAERSREPICTKEDNLVARMTDLSFDDDIPDFALDDIIGITDFIVKTFL